MKKHHPLTLKAFYSVTKAFWGNVTPNLRAIYVLFKEQDFFEMVFCYDQKPTEDEEELASLADTEIISNFSSSLVRTDYRIEVIPYPQKLSENGMYLYHRYEEGIKIDPKLKPDLSLLKDREFRDYELELLVLKALLDKVTSNLRGVGAVLEEDKILLSFYCDSLPSELEKWLLDEVRAELINDLFRSYNVEQEIITLSYPNRMPNSRLAYKRFE